MKIVAPISRANELDPVLAAGADEIYFGVVPKNWNNRFGLSTTGRRLFGNIQEEDHLQSIVVACQEANRSASLVLNAQQYSGAQAQALLALAERFAALGGQSIILADAPLLLRLKQRELPLRLHLSSIAACRNTMSARLFHRLGANRIVFPRHMQLDEMQHMIQDCPDIEFEAFVLNDGCPYDEGVCHTLHLPQHLGGPICMDHYQQQYFRVDGATISDREQQRISSNDEDYAHWRWHKFSCGFSQSEQGYGFGPCGICALKRLQGMKLTAIKIAGREAPLARKLKSIELVARFRNLVETGASASDLLKIGRQQRARPDLCDSGYMCYYPEVLAQDAARQSSSSAKKLSTSG